MTNDGEETDRKEPRNEAKKLSGKFKCAIYVTLKNGHHSNEHKGTDI